MPINILRSLLLLLTSVGSAIAQDPSFIPSVRVHGDATVSAQPDRAQMDIGIITQGPTSQAASDASARQSNGVVDQLKTVVPSANIKTVNFSVNPNYEYPKDGGTPKILGYTANNTVRLEIDDLSLIRKVIEMATRSGANNVNRLNFLLRDEAAARAEALGKAAAVARTSSQALANSLSLKLGRVLHVEEEQPVIVSPGRQVELSASKGQAADMPVEPGRIEIHASVNVTFELIQ